MRRHWQKETRKLRDRHYWTAQPGCKVFVADRGAVRFDFPQEWVIVPGSDSINLYDKAPPDDDCVLAVSYLRLPPIDWSGLPLATLVEQTTKDDTRPIYEGSETCGRSPSPRATFRPPPSCSRGRRPMRSGRRSRWRRRRTRGGMRSTSPSP